MTDTLEIIKNHMKDYLKDTGRTVTKPFNCANPNHEDRHPSMSYDSKSNKVHCFSCGKSYDILDLIGIDYHLSDFKDQIEKAGELYGIDTSQIKPNEARSSNKQTNTQPKQEQASNEPKNDFTDKFNEWHKDIQQAEHYLTTRGISIQTANRFNLGHCSAFPTNEINEENGLTSYSAWNALTIPTSESSYVVRNLNLRATKKNRYRKQGNAIFNAQILTESNEPIFVVEGEIDALSIYEAGGVAVALGSTANADKFIRYLQEHKPAQPLLLALDNDEAGKTATEELTKKLDEININYEIADIYGMSKDANEALIISRETLEEEIKDAKRIEWRQREKLLDEYEKTQASNQIPNFLEEIKENEETPAVSTGFNHLDNILDGGLYKGLYAIGAVSALGKTTLTLQIADQIAQQGKDVLIFSLEMARNELIAKSISRLTHFESEKQKYRQLSKTTRQILKGTKQFSTIEKKAVSDSIEKYKKYANHLYIHEGVGNIGVKQIRETIDKHIDLAGTTPIVIIDYLQILAPFSDKMTDKQNTDKAILELKRMSRDFKTPIIVISSFNRESYKKNNGANGKVFKSDFKESGAIEYSADVLIGLQFAGAGGKQYDEQTEMQKQPREVVLRVLKNRNGQSYTEDYFQFYSYTNYYKECKKSDFTISK